MEDTLKLREQINRDLKQAMYNKQPEVVSTLRMFIAALHNKEIAIRQGKTVELSDQQIIDVVASEIKKHQDSVASYRQGARQDLVDKEEEEIEILKKYLPKQLEDEELEKVIEETIKENNISSLADFGKVMGQVMNKVKGKADGIKVGELIKKKLS